MSKPKSFKPVKALAIWQHEPNDILPSQAVYSTYYIGWDGFALEQQMAMLRGNVSE
jgi:hypothetical protein